MNDDYSKDHAWPSVKQPEIKDLRVSIDPCVNVIKGSIRRTIGVL